MVWADTYKPIPSDYYAALDLSEVANKLYPFGLVELDLSRKGQISDSLIQQIYFNENQRNEMAVLKLDIALESGATKLKLSEQEFVCHAKTSRGRNYALYLKGRSEADFDSLCSVLVKQPATTAKFQWVKLMISDAQAADMAACDQKPKLNQHLVAVTASVSDSIFAQRLGTCVTQSLSGMKNYAIGLIDTAQLLMNPEKLWASLSEQASALKSFVLNIRSELTQLSQQLGNLDSELILHYGCQMAGQTLAAAGAGALTGVGFLKLGSLFSQSLVKLNSMKPLFERLNALKRKGKGEVAKEIMSCAR